MVINNIIKPEMNVTFGNEIICLQTNKNTKHSLVLKIAQNINKNRIIHYAMLSLML